MNEHASLLTFAAENGLPNSFIESAKLWFLPLVSRLKERISLHQDEAKSALIVGINGAQGSGKSTLSSLLIRILRDCHGMKACCMSLDDFYLSKKDRQALADTVHPLLQTRGVPGTHNIKALLDTLENLKRGFECTIPVFDKASDDIAPINEWHKITGSMDIVILEGWCVGTPSQDSKSLKQAVNELEAKYDQDGEWRRFVNKALEEQYQDVFAKIEYLIMLKAPSFERIYAWRLEQEHKMQANNLKLNRAKGGMSDEEIATFIAHYQRITEHGLKCLPPICDEVFELNEHRSISTCHFQ